MNGHRATYASTAPRRVVWLVLLVSLLVATTAAPSPSVDSGLGLASSTIRTALGIRLLVEYGERFTPTTT